VWSDIVSLSKRRSYDLADKIAIGSAAAPPARFRPNPLPIAVLPVDERIYSITFTSNGETWLATVGEELRGSVTRTQKSLGQKVERKALLSNGSTVMAIFAGNPYQVFHDNASRVWANPFLVGSPTSVARFKGQSPAGSQAS
jgi:hypothetical protein